MIGHIEGKIIVKLAKAIVVSTGSVGYQINLPNTQLDASKQGSQVSLFIHTHVRENEISLYGFQDLAELKLFQQLINISGIGPRLATDFLSISQQDLKSAIANEDIDFITTIPGVGKKTAQRVILELKNKIDLDDINMNTTRKHKAVNEDAINALENLGYQAKEINQILDKAPSDTTKTEDVIKYFLQNV